MNKYSFVCGCQVNILEELKDSYKLKIDYNELLYNLNYSSGCPKVWDMLAEGKTKGVFQLEGYLGNQWSMKLQPNSIKELAILVSIIRPSCLQAVSDGKNMSQHLVDRKHKIEPVNALHPSIESILKETYQIMVFQEDSIRVSTLVAGFSEEEADNLRKAIGKKDAKLMAEIRQRFLYGCKETKIIDDKIANQLFDWIQESQRYAFNQSHATSYSQIGYLSSFVKYHFPIQFFSSYLTFAKDKIDHVKEIKELIEEAKKFNIGVLTPRLETLFSNNCNIAIDNNNILRFGLRSMKSFGESSISKFKEVISKKEENFGPIHKWSWNNILYHLLPDINSQSVNSLITGGVLDSLGLTRSEMLLQYQKIKELTKKQLELIREYDLPLFDGLEKVKEKVNVKQKEKIGDLQRLIKNSTHSMNDRVSWIISSEKDVYGIPISYNPIDVLKFGSNSDTTCKEFLDGKEGNMIIAGELEDVKSFKIKSGKNAGKYMAKGKINDGSATIDCVLFQKNYDQYYKIMENGNLVCINGKRSDSNSLIIDTMQEVY